MGDTAAPVVRPDRGEVLERQRRVPLAVGRPLPRQRVQVERSIGHLVLGEEIVDLGGDRRLAGAHRAGQQQDTRPSSPQHHRSMGGRLRLAGHDDEGPPSTVGPSTGEGRWAGVVVAGEQDRGRCVGVLEVVGDHPQLGVVGRCRQLAGDGEGGQDTAAAQPHGAVVDGPVLVVEIAPVAGDVAAQAVDDVHRPIGSGAAHPATAVVTTARNARAVTTSEFDQIFEACGRLGVPVLIHTGEPAPFFDPIDASNERWLELQVHPERRRPPSDYPTFEALMAERDRLFARHPGPRFIAAHFGFHANDLGRLGALLDRLPERLHGDRRHPRRTGPPAARRARVLREVPGPDPLWKRHLGTKRISLLLADFRDL